jgi:PAS domain-containing protein
MGLLRPTAIIAAFLIIAFSAPPALLSQTASKPSQPKRPAPRQSHPKRPPRADALAAVISDLLRLDPLEPRMLDEKDSENANAPSKEKGKPPADDAPIKDLIDYYWDQDHGANTPKPSDKVRQRLLEACEDRPELMLRLIEYLPETPDADDRLYKLLDEEDGENSDVWKASLQNWLLRNSRYFRDDLLAAAREEAANGTPPGDYLLSLARLDWEAARPLVETLASAGTAQMTPVAWSLLYERAQAVGDSSQAEKYRAILKAIIVNHQAPFASRQTALSSLAKTEWNGQEEWVISLFVDPALSKLEEDGGENSSGSKFQLELDIRGQKYTLNVLSPLMEINPERWLPVISSLVGHNQLAVHQSAVGYLTMYLRRESADKKLKKEIAQKLAPWLTDPNWAAADGRSSFIKSLVDVEAPELLSGLIWVLDHDGDKANRAAAAEALIQYRDQAAVPALRRALEKEEDEDSRREIVTALAECGGLSDDEMAAAVEAYAKMVITEEGEDEIDKAKYGDSGKPLPLQVSMGSILYESEKIQTTEGVAVRLIERAKILRASQPAAARRILRGIEDDSIRVVEINLVERIGVGWADLDALKLALQNRYSLQKSAGNELYNLIKQGGYAAGIAAAILKDEREHRETLGGTDAKAQLALLAGARYLRDKLPLELANKMLDSPNRALAKAAESYLEVEDSAEARRLILARRRGETVILGDITAPYQHEAAREWEEEMRNEIKGAGVDAIYALTMPGSAGDFKGVIVRVRGRKAEISLYEVEGRRNMRLLTESEFEGLKSFTSRQDVEDLGPESYGYANYEYLRLTKEGGRRIILDGLRRGPKNPTLHKELSGLFHRLSRSGEFITRYAIEDKIPGVEVLLADKKQEAVMVCGEGREIRVLVGENGAEYKRSSAEAMPEWREYSSGAPGKVTDEPSACRVSGLFEAFTKIQWNDHFNGARSPTRSGDSWIYASYGQAAGVWKFELGNEPAKIISGYYSHPVVTPDGKWLMATKTSGEGGEYTSQLVRHNLQTGEEFQVNLPDSAIRPPFMYLAAHGKVLLGYSGHHNSHYLREVNHLLDAETGAILEAKGDFGPLNDDFMRELQPTGKPNEVWAASRNWNKRSTSFGRYDIRNFVFTPLIELPGLLLKNSDFWVDVNASKIWFTYKGHLLRIPLPAKSK